MQRLLYILGCFRPHDISMFPHDITRKEEKENRGKREKNEKNKKDKKENRKKNI